MSQSKCQRKRNREEASPTRNPDLTFLHEYGIDGNRKTELNDSYGLGPRDTEVIDFTSENPSFAFMRPDQQNQNPSSSSSFSADALLEEIFAEDNNGDRSFTSSELALDVALDSLSGLLGFPNAASVDSHIRSVSYNNGNSQDINDFSDAFGSLSSEEEDESPVNSQLHSSQQHGDESDSEFDEQISNLDDDDIDAMLEDVDGSQKLDGLKSPRVVSKERFFLVDRGNQLFEFLPEGWVKVIHQSGMPVYYHRKSKVCCLSRPYELSRAALRTHKVPISSIPCMEYRKAKEETEMNLRGADSVTTNQTTCPVADPDSHSAKLVTADEHLQKSLLTPLEVRDYCSKLFDFETKFIRRYKNWKVGRGRQRLAKKLLNPGQSQQSTVPATMLKNSKVVTISRPGPDGKSVVSFILNPANKTPVSVLHEFVQHTRKTQPNYEFLEMPDSNLPYEAIIIIDGKEEGRGVGASKKAAKLEAAKAAINKLVPELRAVVGDDEALAREEEIFRDIAIDDARVMEIAFKAGIAGPYQILTNALRRLHAHTPDQIKFTSQRISHLKNEYTMTTPKHEISVVHEKRNEAKQMAAQKILKEMHPRLKYYGELLKLYGREYQETVKKKKEVQRAITDLQGKGNWGEPNWKLLEKLKQEMKKVTPVPLKPDESSRIRYD